MTVAELQERMELLESRVAELERELEIARLREGVRKGREEAARGEGISAGGLVQSLRVKHGLPRQ